MRWDTAFIYTKSWELANVILINEKCIRCSQLWYIFIHSNTRECLVRVTKYLCQMNIIFVCIFIYWCLSFAFEKLHLWCSYLDLEEAFSKFYTLGQSCMTAGHFPTPLRNNICFGRDMFCSALNSVNFKRTANI